MLPALCALDPLWQSPQLNVFFAEDETFDDLAIEIDVLQICKEEPTVVSYYGSWKKGNELFVSEFLLLLWCSRSLPPLR